MAKDVRDEVTDIPAFLQHERGSILATAEAALERMHMPHYETVAAGKTHERLASLFDHLVESIAKRDLTPSVDYARRIAAERFNDGYDLTEVQTAFNALEESCWACAVEHLEPADLAEALGLVSTVLGSGKDALASSYVSLAASTNVGSLDLRALFAGTA
jgi:hypothetical protein